MHDIHAEKNLIERSRTLLAVAEVEPDPSIRAACLAQCSRLQMRAVRLQLARKAALLAAWGFSTVTPSPQ